MKFERPKEYMRKLVVEAISADKKVHQDAHVEIKRDWSKGGKYRAWCDEAKGYIKFPNKLRKYGWTYIADVIEVKPEGRAVHFRVVKNSIRDIDNEVVG